MQPIVKKIAVVIVIAAGAVAGLLYMRQARRPKQLVLAGTLEARTVNVGSLVGGRVTRVLADEGRPVVPGQLLLTLETDTIDRQLSEQQAAIETARAQLAKTLAGPRPEEIAKAAEIAANNERERRRMLSLYQYGIVAKQLYEDAATKAKTANEDLRILQKGSRAEDIAAARAQVEQQQRRLDTLLKQRTETTVTSPVAGIVQSYPMRPGDLVKPNETVAEILENDQLWVRVFVPETLLGLVRVGMPVRVRVDTYPNDWFPGRVVAVSSQAEYTPRNVQTRAQRVEQVFGVKVLVDPSPRLKAGMATEVDLGVKGRADS
ncbi:MAG TPA: efflux RND transporter periplasmic adaptor subunit [Thermoanaerobaculia bacterium]|nr:efflux RND transporter periplasmic adaptor subunit [Thermoanaerobaculia bacterium]